MVKVLIGGIGLKDIFPETISLGGIEEVIVVNGSGTEVVFERLFFFGVFGDILQNQLA